MLDVLESGGNAVDAMLTAIPLQHVLEPQMSTLAGGMGGFNILANLDLDKLGHYTESAEALALIRKA